MTLATGLELSGLALLIEGVCGYPAWLYGALGHPVSWMGRWLAWLEQRLNRRERSFAARRLAGLGALLALLGVTAVVTLPLDRLTRHPIGLIACAILAASLPAQRSLHRHVADVATALDGHGLAGGRRAVSMIVGRNPASLDEAAVCRAAIESLAENFSDGIVAPAFWLVVGGLTGGALYKAINTADSMIGHKTERYAAFGWAAARLDDLVNLPASRLAAVWIVVAALLLGDNASGAVAAVRRDARQHRSPNAGWPEAAMAGALGLQLAGPRVYGDTLVSDAFMGAGRREATTADIRRALRLYRAACGLQLAALAALVGMIGIFA